MQQPPPQVQAQMKMKDQEGQTRKDIMQMKVQADQAKTASNERLKTLQISEESARHIIQQILDTGGPEAKMMEARLKAAQGQQELQQKGQQHALALRAQQQKHLLDMQKQQNQMGMDMRRAAMDHQVNQATGLAKVQQLLAQGRAKAAASRKPQQGQ